jgi:hypothetical protein
MFRTFARWSPASEDVNRPWVLAGLLVWLASVGTGLGWLADYTNQAGASAMTAPASIAPQAAPSPHRFRLLMFAHPHCPCTAASLNELARLMSGVASDVDATVYFYRPASAADDWALGRLWSSAAAIPGVQVQTDPNGDMAARFGSTTSGEVLLYDASGHLRFHGGITSGRGHEGDNLGETTVTSMITGNLTNVDHCPVFGCTIHSAAQRRAD